MPESRTAWFQKQLQKFQRIALTGIPRSGKTTLSRWCKDRPILHADSYAHRGWSEASRDVAADANATPGKLLIEGVAIPRALRKGLRVDVVIVLSSRGADGKLVGALQPLLPGQETMGKAVHTVLDEWADANPTVPVLYAPPAMKDFREEEDAEEEKAV